MAVIKLTLAKVQLIGVPALRDHAIVGCALGLAGYAARGFDLKAGLGFGIARPPALRGVHAEQADAHLVSPATLESVTVDCDGRQAQQKGGKDGHLERDHFTRANQQRQREKR